MISENVGYLLISREKFNILGKNDNVYSLDVFKQVNKEDFYARMIHAIKKFCIYNNSENVY